MKVESNMRVHLEYFLSFLLIPFVSIYVSFRNIDFTVKKDIKYQLFRYKKWKEIIKNKENNNVK